MSYQEAFEDSINTPKGKKKTKTIKIRQTATMFTDLEYEEEIKVPVDMSDEDIRDTLNDAEDPDGGLFSEVEGIDSGGWDYGSIDIEE